MTTSPAPATWTRAQWLTRLDAEQRRLLTAARGPGRAPGRARPGWRVDDVVDHLAGLYGRVATLLRRGSTAAPPPTPRPPAAGEGDPVERFTAAAAELRAAVAATRAEDPAWTWAACPDRAGFWWRRMTQETLVHRVDVELATGRRTPVDPGLATDGVDEVLSVFLPSGRGQAAWPGPPALVRVRAEDTGATWEVALAPGPPRLVARAVAGGAGPLAGAVADGVAADGVAADGVAAELAGPAQELLLALWGRAELAACLRAGDLAAAAALRTG